jgi:hypothetical protein
MRRATDEILMRRYFLGDLPQEERDRLENRYLADGEIFEELIATEHDLIDAYVRGELTDDERRKFELEYFKSPQRRQKVGFARALNQVSALANQAVVSQTASPWKKVWAAFSVQQMIPQWALGAAAVMIVASGSLLMMQNYRLGVALQQGVEGQAALRREEDTLRQHIAELEGNSKDQFHKTQEGSQIAKLETPMGPEVTLMLTPDIARGLERPQNTLTLPTNTSHLRFQLMLDRDEYKTYEAVLMTVERKEVLVGKALQGHKIRGNFVVTWRLSADLLPSGDYVVQLKGQPAAGSLEDVESYSFRVLRR